MKGYFAFPPSTIITSTPTQPLKEESTTTCTTRGNHPEDAGNVAQAMQDARQKRREHERALGERSEIEWVRTGGILRDALGRRDMTRTERIRRELNLQEVERQRVARWEAHQARWHTMQSSSSPITFIDFPWPVAERLACRDLSPLTHRAVSEFLFEGLAVRANTTTKKEKIRSALLRWHPDKIAFVLTRVVSDDLELVREGIHVVFGVFKALQDTERTGVF